MSETTTNSSKEGQALTRGQFNAAKERRRKSFVRARDEHGHFVAESGTPTAKTVKDRAYRTERNYLKSVVKAVGTNDVHAVAQAIVADALQGDEKCRNAAREWLGKYVLGGGKVSLEDIAYPQVITKRR